MNSITDVIKQYCPNGVEEASFGEVASYIRGITYNKNQEAKPTDEHVHKVLRANNITLYLNTLNFDDVKLVKKEVKVKPEQELKKGDILICAGSGSKEHVGKVAYIANNMDFTFGGFMAVIRPTRGLNNRYLFHVLVSRLFSEYLATNLSSTTINNLNSGLMNGFRFPLPPLPVQNEIVNILDSLTELQENLQHELDARKKQYNYYSEKLLTFDTI